MGDDSLLELSMGVGTRSVSILESDSRREFVVDVSRSDVIIGKSKFICSQTGNSRDSARQPKHLWRGGQQLELCCL